MLLNYIGNNYTFSFLPVITAKLIKLIFNLNKEIIIIEKWDKNIKQESLQRE